jgi:hypothetical protein
MFKIQDVVGKIQMLRDAPGVINVIERAAAVLGRSVSLKFGQAALIPQLHRQADDWAPLLPQNGRDSG